MLKPPLMPKISNSCVLKSCQFFWLGCWAAALYSVCLCPDWQ